MTKHQRIELSITITTILAVTALLGIPVFHFAAAMIINTAWRHRHTGLMQPIYSQPAVAHSNRKTAPDNHPATTHS